MSSARWTQPPVAIPDEFQAAVAGKAGPVQLRLVAGDEARRNPSAP